MAPKTYPQQIADLKQEREELLDKVSSLNEQVAMAAELRDEISVLREKLQSAGQAQHGSDVSLKAKLNDANQRADSEAAHARRVVDENTRLAHVNGELHNRLEKIEHEKLTWSKKDDTIRALNAENETLLSQLQTFNRQATDAVNQARNDTNSMADELRRLRLAIKDNEKLVAQVVENANKAVSEATEKATRGTELANWYKAEWEKAIAAINRYREVVNSLPDTKAELQGILMTVSHDQSPV